jgi:hypothetical protein
MAGSPNKHAHDSGQGRLPLSREARFAVLAMIEAERLGMSDRQWQRLKRIMEAIELSTTRDGPVAHVEALATKCRCDRRTVMRAAESGRRAGVLRWEHERDAEGRQAANRWSVAWDRLAGIAGWRSGEPPPDAARGWRPE